MIVHLEAAFGGSECLQSRPGDRVTDHHEAVTCTRCRWLTLAHIDIEDGSQVARDCAESWGWLAPQKKAA